MGATVRRAADSGLAVRRVAAGTRDWQVGGMDAAPTDVELPAAIVRLVDELAALPGVEAVALGGSRAQGTARPDSDWDLGVYHRDGFDPSDVRALGYDGTVVGIGAWGGGVFNGGAWLRLDTDGRRGSADGDHDGRRGGADGDRDGRDAGLAVDLLWRDLGVVEHEVAEAEAGRWRTEPLMFHLAGIPTYLVVAELARNRTLVGTLPVPEYPDALRRAAGRDWAERAELTLDHAMRQHARHGRVAACLGLLAVGAAEYAHAVAATTGTWVTNDKTLYERGGMADVDRIVGGIGAGPTPADLERAVAATTDLGRGALAAARARSLPD